MKTARTPLLALALLSLSVACHAATYDFTISLNGQSEVPPTGSVAAGGGLATFNDSLNTISVSLFFAGLQAPATLSHIHRGPPGVNGSPIVNLTPFTPNATSGTIISGPLAFPVADIPALFAGNTYFNIHNAVYPGGEIRGQLIPVPEPSAIGLTLAGLGLAAWLRRRL